MQLGGGPFALESLDDAHRACGRQRFALGGCAAARGSGSSARRGQLGVQGVFGRRTGRRQ
jgi:hypothetical protein